MKGFRCIFQIMLAILLLFVFAFTPKLYALGQCDWPWQSPEAKKNCFNEKLKEKDQEIKQQEESVNTTGQSNNSGNMTIIGPGMFDRYKPGSGKPGTKGYTPKESRFEFYGDVPIAFLASNLQAAKDYELDTGLGEIGVHYNFAEHMHIGAFYLPKKIPAYTFEDTDFGYYDTKYFAVFFGGRFFFTPKWQFVGNVGGITAQVNPEGGEKLSLDNGLSVHLKALYCTDNFKWGPVLNLALIRAKDAKLLADNEKAGYLKLGVQFVFGIPDLMGMVSDYGTK